MRIYAIFLKFEAFFSVWTTINSLNDKITSGNSLQTETLNNLKTLQQTVEDMSITSEFYLLLFILFQLIRLQIL